MLRNNVGIWPGLQGEVRIQYTLSIQSAYSLNCANYQSLHKDQNKGETLCNPSHDDVGLNGMKS